MLLLDFLFPRYSLRGKEGDSVTQSERAQLVSRPRVLFPADLSRMGLSSLDQVLAVSTYSEAPLLREAIYAFKYRKVPLRVEMLQMLMAEAVARYLPLREDSCICPVPLHWTRYFQRGFNQADLLAQALAIHVGLPCRSLLRRVRPTGHQSRRKREVRFNAVHKAFSLKRKREEFPFCVYLIDDLLTTGATMNECAKVLKAAGVKRVEGVVLAHG